MNLPNKLTVLRVLMIPLFLIFFYLGNAGAFSIAYLIAFLLFVLAAVTDALDGNIARKRGLVTDFGKLMDPLADKLLVMSAMVSFISLGLVHPVVVIVILAREFLVTSIRLIAASNGTVIPADGWGKAKTVLQMVWICCALFFLSLGAIPALAILHPFAQLYFRWCNPLLVGAVALLTVVSGVNYTVKNRALFADK